MHRAPKYMEPKWFFVIKYNGIFKIVFAGSKDNIFGQAKNRRGILKKV
jgi:hypothetical protein